MNSLFLCPKVSTCNLVIIMKDLETNLAYHFKVIFSEYELK